MEKDRRRLSRVGFNVEALLNIDGIDYSCMVENISLKGIFLKTDKELSVKCDQNLDLTLLVSGNSSDLVLKLKAIVVRIENKGIAFKFDHVDLDTFIHLRNIVAYNDGSYEKIMGEFYQVVLDKNE